MIEEKEVHLALSEAADLVDRMLAVGIERDAEVVSKVSAMLFAFSASYYLNDMVRSGKPVWKN